MPDELIERIRDYMLRNDTTCEDVLVMLEGIGTIAEQREQHIKANRLGRSEAKNWGRLAGSLDAWLQETDIGNG
jgi:hypothetical protein